MHLKRWLPSANKQKKKKKKYPEVTPPEIMKKNIYNKDGDPRRGQCEWFTRGQKQAGKYELIIIKMPSLSLFRAYKERRLILI